jgi:hypothetical protein
MEQDKTAPANDGKCEGLTRELDDLLTTIRASDIDKAFYSLCIIRKAQTESQAELLRYLAEHWDDAVSSDERQIEAKIDTNQEKELVRNYARIVDEMLSALVFRNLGESVFYSELWNLVNNPFFPDDRVKSFALYWILIDEKTPYFQVGEGIRMSDDEFRVRARSVSRNYAKVRFIVSRKFEQRSERAALVLQELESISDEVDRAVVLALLLRRFERNTKIARQADSNKIVIGGVNP